MLNAAAKPSCFNVRVIKKKNKKKSNSILVVEEGAKRERFVV